MSDQDKAEVIQAEVYKYLHVEPDNSRKRQVVEARHFSMYYMRKYTRLSLSEIGRRFDRDHASVLNAVKNIDNLINWNGYKKTDGRLRYHIERGFADNFCSWANKIPQL